MKILLLPNLHKKKYDLQTIAIKQIFEDKGYFIEEEINPATIYDYIITFDKKSISRIKKVFWNKSKIIYITYTSEVAREHFFNEACIYKSFIFLDKKRTLNLVGANTNILMNMLAPNFNSDKITNKAEGDKPRIYIDIDNDMLNSDVCLKILPLMNTLSDYQIYLYTKNRTIASLKNKHIKIVKDLDGIVTHINNSDIVIGSGYPALLACKLKKKVIVVGERGYGGLVKEASIRAFYLNFFQGRNGGKLDEYIPLQILLQDIQTIIDEQEKQLLLEKLQQSEIENINSFLSIFEDYITDADDIDKRYTINPCYSLREIDRYFYIIDVYMGKQIKRINESECLIMMEFLNSNSMSALLDKYPVEYKDDIFRFAEELIEKKYLIPYVESDFISQGHPPVIE
ncbi:hypothetical protein [Dysgonomonas sp. ZJ709]|uniref:hypothetical protein n=1 Tax=Dysgonomonas sp. ZJ709 TaxID=2709797 RepID=UPI0013ECCB7E|nr:hypothetical protein [Dysgonomonas sp. ZJ709]